MLAMVSGGFDPLHIGHVKLIEAAAHHGEVVVALNSDEWLLQKKDFIFMPFEERKYILERLNHVLYVIGFDDGDGTVNKALHHVKPNFFCNGGDRGMAHPFEHETCVELGISEVFDVGGGKIQSSSDLVEKVLGVKI